MKMGGIDEAGRGPVIGPLVIAAVVVDESRIGELESLGVKDSKKLTPKKREELFEKIVSIVDDYFILKLSPEEIDSREGTMNELEIESFARVLNSLKVKPDILYIDAADVKEERFGDIIGEKLSFSPKIVAEHKADAKYIPVAAASILAKVTRDRAIEGLKEIYGEIGSGYPSDPVTRKFLEEYYKKHGEFPPIVRKSWKTLKKIEEKLKTKKAQPTILDFLKKP
ncbi:MAG: ribonuclease [Thermococcaceae archaeon]|jgi:ribonuclease HII|uniref:ribonuclease HII n=1 Tax=Thermococcus TaxID=2263 RepID=UPI0005B2734F|nr:MULTISPECIES: ribonuclease HII [Thermococcus]MDK2783505.1 ribonuclease [Thermococcaceae archaeon]MCA6213106.1 ribonuclease HII [Thermococcus bergensis]MDK2983866.1 ribonuclease [Thermococcaceae archaeon]MDN5321544.1 ribonuclease [Thermococcaceae archaeon]MPW38132.1 ribonuclease HII [Thermococcus sp. 101 C5]